MLRGMNPGAALWIRSRQAVYQGNIERVVLHSPPPPPDGSERGRPLDIRE
jgi:hypothetical protein